MSSVATPLESGLELMAAHEASAPEPAPVAADVFGNSNQDPFTSTIVPESVPQDAPPAEVPSPLAVSAPTPVPPSPQPDWQQALAQERALIAQERQAFLETLRGFAPKPESVPEQEPDYLAMLPPEMRSPENLPTAKYMYQMAKAQADAVRQELNKRDQAAQFQAQVTQAHQSAQQVVQNIASRGFDFNIQGGDKARAGIETLAKAFAARWGGDPIQHEPQILEMIDAAARARIAGQIAQNKNRQALQTPASRVPPMHGAPGTAPSQLPGAKRLEVPTEAQARAQGYPSLAEWYAKNM